MALKGDTFLIGDLRGFDSGGLHATCSPVSVPSDGTPSLERALDQRVGAAKNTCFGTRPIWGRIPVLRLTRMCPCANPHRPSPCASMFTLPPVENGGVIRGDAVRTERNRVDSAWQSTQLSN